VPPIFVEDPDTAELLMYSEPTNNSFSLSSGWSSQTRIEYPAGPRVGDHELLRWTQTLSDLMMPAIETRVGKRITAITCRLTTFAVLEHSELFEERLIKDVGEIHCTIT